MNAVISSGGSAYIPRIQARGARKVVVVEGGLSSAFPISLGSIVCTLEVRPFSSRAGQCCLSTHASAVFRHIGIVYNMQISRRLMLYIRYIYQCFYHFIRENVPVQLP